MTTPPSSQVYDTYIPLYDAIPEKWDDARPFLVQNLRRISLGVNAREVGWVVDEELLTGKQFIPGTNGQFRSIFRKVIVFGAQGAGTVSQAHGILVDANFTLIDLWGTATASGFTGTPINQPNINYDSVNINLTLTASFVRVYAFIEYIQEI